jgi:pSer/pThr/pTyr-binding forkhead associated (FHA) protein
MSTAIALRFMSGPRDGEIVNLHGSGTPATVEIGRSAPASGLALPSDPDVSRAHARLVLREAAWWLEDVGSRNGTFIGEFAAAKKLSAPVCLRPGDVFRCGLTRLRVETGPQAQIAAEAAHQRNL